MDTNALIVSAVRSMALTIASVLGTSAIDTTVTINDETVFSEEVG